MAKRKATRVLLVRGIALITTLVIADPATGRSQGSSRITGRVVDSLSNTGLAGALVQLLAADNTAKLVQSSVSDSGGHFMLTGLGRGDYVLGFAHALLDSLGVEVPLKQIRIRDGESIRIDLGTPSARTMMRALCGSNQPGAALVGNVRSLAGLSVAEAGVKIEWVELSLTRDGLKKDLKVLESKSSPDGWYSFCSLPTAGVIVVSASYRDGVTGRIEIMIPASGLMRRDLYIGNAEGAAKDGEAIDRISSRSAGKLSGTVHRSVDHKPIVGASVTIADGPTAVTRVDGSWSLTGLSTGTQLLAVRAIGYYPKTETVDVHPDSKPIAIELPTLKSVLDTIRITARSSSDLDDFAKRRRIGNGHFLTPSDIARFPATITSNLFRMIPGVRFTLRDGQRFFELRGVFEPWCSPAIFVNGHNMTFMSADDLDDYVRPERVAGIEVYTGAVIPPQFQIGLGGCGSIVVWTR